MTTLEKLRRSHPNQEPPFQASKWLEIPALLDVEEMDSLFSLFTDCFCFPFGSVLPASGECDVRTSFLSAYKAYINTIKSGDKPEPSEIERSFSLGITSDESSLYVMPVGENKALLKLISPVIQISAHFFDYSPVDGKIRSKIKGKETVSWGVLIAFPQLYMDPDTKEVVNTVAKRDLPNAKLFHQVQKWIRSHTLPTPFLTADQKIHAPIRIGKDCLKWVNSYAELDRKGLKVNGL